jgi:hypothetical protein
MAENTVTPPVGSAEPLKELAATHGEILGATVGNRQAIVTNKELQASTSAKLQQPDRCPSCGALRGGNYCISCGERFLDSRDLHFTYFLRKHFIHDFFDVDGRVARTRRSLLMRPGELAVNFIAGASFIRAALDACNGNYYFAPRTQAS